METLLIVGLILWSLVALTILIVGAKIYSVLNEFLKEMMVFIEKEEKEEA